MKFSGKVGNGPANKRLNFGGDPSHHMDTVTVFRIRQSPLRNVINGHSTLLIRQMAALVRCALADVCTVPVLHILLFSVFKIPAADTIHADLRTKRDGFVVVNGVN